MKNLKPYFKGHHLFHVKFDCSGGTIILGVQVLRDATIFTPTCYDKFFHFYAAAHSKLAVGEGLVAAMKYFFLCVVFGVPATARGTGSR